MNYPYYTAEPKPRPDNPVDLPLSQYEQQTDPQYYLPDEGLVDAVNVALMLGQPLLLTGEAGAGKTQLAYHIAHQLGLDRPLKFETKSDSKAKDLFYFYDYLAHFHGKENSCPQCEFITYHALGLAILRANPYAKIKDLVNQAYAQDYQDKPPTRSVVLIDEIDKAQRDFPNDILNEVELMSFKIPELENAEIKADVKMRPILILTSNSEKHLPDAFLRRCIYYHIPFPDDDRLKQIIDSRLGNAIKHSTPFIDNALDLFFKLRDSGMQKKPATAELLNWLTVLKMRFKDSENPLSKPHQSLTLSTLVKNEEDIAIAKAVIENWNLS